ncbi:transcriptional-regulating factor 1-like isoform X2 [Thalassophryne amazonica]|uniref:transcriptional-regulating factor 1-like isoform X2 n=1 Tax=Thalassophryne amazonica TaxID=390379 RepID=UPI0014725E0F|nr:transcriptional-regulating factor 1-like isoform X2 [Thalassophryne amazonica]
MVWSDPGSSQTHRVIMEDRSSPHTFSNVHHHRHRLSFHLTLPGLQTLEAGYPSSLLPSLDALESYGSTGEEPATLFPNSNTSSWGRRESTDSDKGLANLSESGLEGDASLGGHLDRNGTYGSHFAEPWYGSGKTEDIWDDGESCESPTDDFYSTSHSYENTIDAFFPRSSDKREGDFSFGCNHRARANSNSCDNVSVEAKSEIVYNRGPNIIKQNLPYNRSKTGRFSDSSVDYCGTDSWVNDNYFGKEEGSSSGSTEDQLPPLEALRTPRLSNSPSQTACGGWQGGQSSCPPVRSPLGTDTGTYTQKLDSFSEAFLSQRKRRFPMIPIGDSFGHWEGEVTGSTKSSHNCAFDSNSFLPPSSSSPAHLSVPSFPSPPATSHFMSSVLSPPPTPLPPPPVLSPFKMDSPGAPGGTGHSEALSTIQCFPPCIKSLPPAHSSGIMWKFPLLSHCFPHLSGDPNNSEGDLRALHSNDYNTITGSHDLHQSPESSLPPPALNRTSLHLSRALCPAKIPALHPPFCAPSPPSGQRRDSGEKIAHPVVSQKGKNRSQLKQSASVYTGTPFPSILHSSKHPERSHYTPRPLLCPVRRGTGLYSSLSSLHHSEDGAADIKEEHDVSPHINLGSDFQAELLSCPTEDGGLWVGSPEEEFPREQLLWKPWDELQESSDIQQQVEKLLSMCSSSCLPGGGSNIELALHCLHHCQGNTMATLEMLLFSEPSPTGDYHYSGSDLWTDTERISFSAALEMYGKDFSLIQKMVKTKTVQQCVESYYLRKKLLDKQKKQKQEEAREVGMEQPKSVPPICQPVNRHFGLQEAVPVPSLASFFPCKLCGKMFYKIKSRNAHMKIHRQPQDDWNDKRLQHQLLTQRFALSRPTNHIVLPTQVQPFSSSGLTVTSSNNSDADNILNSIAVTSNHTATASATSVLDHSSVLAYSGSTPNCHITNPNSGMNQRDPASVIPVHQPWSSFGHCQEPSTFYCEPKVEEPLGIETIAEKSPMNWS